ncbi:MAG: tetratricopeptide repeat protein [Candidatus Aminicenantes bacterium]|nr:tetratricopeptide repeat protein [Candidatus Aminicenantes bacterium]
MKRMAWGVFIIIFFLFHCATSRVSVSGSKPAGGESYVSCLARGMRSLGDKKYDEAISALQQASMLKPDSDKAYNFLGIGYFMKKNFAEAVKCFQKALAINPAYASAVCNLGNLQFETGEVDAAVATLSKGIAEFADNVALHFSLGNILLHRGEIDEGFAHLAKVMELDPGYLGRAKSFSLETSASDIPRTEIFFRYARLYASVGNLEKTLEYLGKAKESGFNDWKRIRQDDAFAALREDPQVKKYFE